MKLSIKEIENAAENLFRTDKYSLRKRDVAMTIMLNQATKGLTAYERDKITNRIWRCILKLYY